MKTYTNENISTPKQFNSAIKEVFGSIATRNQQVQQLLILAVNEAAKEVNGQVGNNLNWLTMLLNQAEQTKGIALVKVVKYVKEVLCCNTVSWNAETAKLTKVKTKGVKLTYNTAPLTEWYSYGKKETLKKAFDYSKAVTSSITSALDEKKGGLTKLDIIRAVMGAGFGGQEVIDLMIEVADGDAEALAIDDEIVALEALVEEGAEA